MGVWEGAACMRGPHSTAAGPHAEILTYPVPTLAHAAPAQVGYLYLTDAPRLHLLMQYLGIGGDHSGARAAISL